MNCCRETVERSVPPGNRRGWTRGVLEQYVAGSDTRGRPEGRSYPRSQQATREISGLIFRVELNQQGEPADSMYSYALSTSD